MQHEKEDEESLLLSSDPSLRENLSLLYERRLHSLISLSQLFEAQRSEIFSKRAGLDQLTLKL
jgi:hypothetical protein